MDLLRHFKHTEFACPCCGEQHMNFAFLTKLDAAREIAGVPFYINSGYRCLKHNQQLGSEPTSSHLKGLASDIAASDSFVRSRIITGLLMAGLNRIGIDENFIHTDADPDKPRDVMWLYKHEIIESGGK